MTFDAAAVADLQACPRRYVLNQSWHPLRWNPRHLFDAILRRAVLHLSQKQGVGKVRQAARAQYLQSAVNPGIDVPEPYPIALEYVILLDVLIETLSRAGVPEELKEGPMVHCGEFSWRVSALLDSGGCPHRYLTVDYWDEARQKSEPHSWWVAGDIAVLGKPMTLHVIEIGQMRGGQRASLWVRGYRNPKIPNVRRIRFIPKSGTFKGWTPVRLADLHADVESWVEMLLGDDVPQRLLHTIQVAPANPQKRAAVLADLEAEAARAGRLAPVAWRELPMHRGACDGFSPCPFQPVCYEDTDPTTSGLYVIREQPAASIQGKTPVYSNRSSVCKAAP